jgi:MAP/microtubule affinity-regulating kinase
MLTIDPEERPTISELLTYPWFKKHSEITRKHKLPEDLLEDLNTITKNMSYITPTS